MTTSNGYWFDKYDVTNKARDVLVNIDKFEEANFKELAGDCGTGVVENEKIVGAHFPLWRGVFVDHDVNEDTRDLIRYAPQIYVFT